MKIAFYGSSLLSSYWNGAATYYRGVLNALAARGHEIAFYEPDIYDRQAHRDIEPPPWARSIVYQADEESVRRVLAEGAGADVMVKASGVGAFDDALLDGVARGPDTALKIFWDVDAPATLAEARAADHPLRAAVSRLDQVLTYGGGPPVVAAYEALGARRCEPVYNALDPQTHHPEPPQARFVCDLAFLANRLPDRERRAHEFFLGPAHAMPEKSFLLGGSGWRQEETPGNVRCIGHVYVHEHNALNCSARAVLNVARDSMAEVGFSPATRVFEAAGAGACLITDAWEGVELFLEPGREILVARDGRDVAEALRGLDATRAAAIGAAAKARTLAEHTYERRAEQVDRLLREGAARKREEALT